MSYVSVHLMTLSLIFTLLLAPFWSPPTHIWLFSCQLLHFILQLIASFTIWLLPLVYLNAGEEALLRVDHNGKTERYKNQNNKLKEAKNNSINVTVKVEFLCDFVNTSGPFHLYIIISFTVDIKLWIRAALRYLPPHHYGAEWNFVCGACKIEKLHQKNVPLSRDGIPLSLEEFTVNSFSRTVSSVEKGVTLQFNFKTQLSLKPQIVVLTFLFPYTINKRDTKCSSESSVEALKSDFSFTVD